MLAIVSAPKTSEQLERAVTVATEDYLVAARDLSRKRHAAATGFATSIESLLTALAMGRTHFEVRFNSTELSPERWSERGIDEAEFFVSPNPGEDLRPLARIVSGGELSRVMLALKTLAAGGRSFDCFSLLRPTSPFRTADTIRRAWATFARQEGADSLRAIEKCTKGPFDDGAPGERQVLLRYGAGAHAAAASRGRHDHPNLRALRV